MPFKVTGKPKQTRPDDDALSAFSPQTQSDIVDNKYPANQMVTKVFHENDMPGLTADLTDRDEVDSISSFIWMSLRTRAGLKVWELSLSNCINEPSTKWTTVADSKRTNTTERKKLAEEIATKLTSTPNIVGVRISVDKGLQMATNSTSGIKTEKKLSILYREK